MQTTSGLRFNVEVKPPLESRKTDCSSCAHVQSCLPRSLVGSDLLSVFEDVVESSQIIERGQPLFEMGDTFSQLHIIKSGTFKAVSVGTTSVIMGFHFPTNVVGIDSISTGYHTHSLIALERAVVCNLNYLKLLEQFRRFPQVEVSFINAMSAQFDESMSLFMVIRCGTVLQRVATFLLYVTEQYGRLNLASADIVLPMGRTDISNFIGVSAESLSRNLTHLSGAGILRVFNRRITLIDREALAGIALGYSS